MKCESGSVSKAFAYSAKSFAHHLQILCVIQARRRRPWARGLSKLHEALIPGKLTSAMSPLLMFRLIGRADLHVGPGGLRRDAGKCGCLVQEGDRGRVPAARPVDIPVAQVRFQLGEVAVS